MPIPRQKRHPLVTTFAVLYLIVVLPIILVYCVFLVGLFVLIVLVTLPWTLYFYSSNWGLLSKDRKLTREYATEIETRRYNVNGLLRSIRRQGAFSSTVKFYPHKAERFFCCIPFVGSYSSTTYRYPMLTELFTRLEDAGWRREAIYDLFIGEATTGEMKEELKKVKARACRGAILGHVFDFMAPALNLLTNWLDAPPNMLKSTRNVIEVDLKGDVQWVLTRGAVIRPKDRRTLYALNRLDRALGMWKFVEKEEDLKEEGWWQYIVL